MGIEIEGCDFHNYKTDILLALMLLYSNAVIHKVVGYDPPLGSKPGHSLLRGITALQELQGFLAYWVVVVVSHRSSVGLPDVWGSNFAQKLEVCSIPQTEQVGASGRLTEGAVDFSRRSWKPEQPSR